MPTHHFTTPRVVYLGLAYGEKEQREPGAAAGAPRAPDRPARGRMTMRRSERRPRASVR